ALDAATSGGLGVAFFWPFDKARHFLPWRPIVVSPFSPAAFLSDWGRRVILSELRWVWGPCLIFALAGISLRRSARRLGLGGSAHEKPSRAVEYEIPSRRIRP
ncbi:MAG: metal-dependent hydrolase, partial [Deltaproteobacteria bacterium]|nr:metal-dependent hydrolase [Deltaproteobacteria bacterium]